MSYQVTARKWRPMVFDDVVGQQHVSNTLRNALQSNRLAHAFIFSGTRGCGKTTTARILARAVNCLNPNNFEPCNECDVCKEIIDGRSLDVIEIDGASNRGVDEIRNLRESVRYAPTRGKTKVYIIDEVHMLTKEAFNALLKTLEEPPAHVVFIFATTEIHKVPATILSRCQRYDFRRINIDEIVGQLKFIAGEEKISIDDDSLLIIAKKGDGSMRDAQSIFDQVVSFCGMTIDAQQVSNALNIVDQELFFRVSDAVKGRNTFDGLTLVDEVVKSGYDIKEFISGISEHFRNILIAKTTNSTQLIEESEPHRNRYAADVVSFSLSDLLRINKVVTDIENSIRYSVQPRFKLEIMMVQLTKMEQSIKIDELLGQIEDLKKKLHGNIPQPTPIVISGSKSVTEIRSPATPSYIAEAKSSYTISSAKPKIENGNSNGDAIEQKTIESALPISLSTVSIEEVQMEWTKIIDEMRKRKISVGTVLGESQAIEIINGTLRIACGDEFHRSTLLRNKDVLAELINTTFNSKLRIEPFISEIVLENVSRSNKVAGSTTTGTSSKPAVDEEHPLIKTLYKDFGAERV